MEKIHIGGAILAAGLGTRLRPLTEHTPKPLVPMLGRPLIEWGMISLAKAGLRSLGINSFYLAEQLEEKLNFQKIIDEVTQKEQQTSTPDSERPNCFFERSDHVLLHLLKEDEILGTGGGIKGLWKAQQLEGVNSAMLCLNGDALFDFSIKDLIKAHLTPLTNSPNVKQSVATLALRPVPPNDPFGRVGVDAQGRVVRIAEVTGPLSHTEVRVGAFTGAQIVTQSVIDRIPEGFCDVFRTAHRDLLNSEIDIKAHFVPAESLWVDVGNQERYLHAHQLVLDLPHLPFWNFIPPHRRTNNAIIFEGAEVAAKVKLGSNTWIGQGAQVLGKGELSSTVVWPNATMTVNGTQSQTVILPTY